MKEGSRAEKAGLKLGDAILTINDRDTSAMTLQEANNILEESQQKDVKMGVIKWVDLSSFIKFRIEFLLRRALDEIIVAVVFVFSLSSRLFIK